MKKIRINVLARELEVKSHLILELLPDLGVSEKLTHSSSIDDDVADKLRVRFGIAPGGNGDRGAEHDFESGADQHGKRHRPAVRQVVQHRLPRRSTRRRRSNIRRRSPFRRDRGRLRPSVRRSPRSRHRVRPDRP